MEGFNNKIRWLIRQAYGFRDGKFLYGTDWPLTNLESYLALIRHLIPEEHHHAVFCGNALKDFSKLRV